MVDDQALLEAFEHTLATIAGEVGQRSVAPYVEEIGKTVREHHDALHDHNQGGWERLEQTRQALGGAEEAIRQIVDAGRATVDAAVQQAADREGVANGILDEVRRILDEGLAMNRDRFDQAVKALSDSLDQRLASLTEQIDRARDEFGTGTAALAGRLEAAERVAAELTGTLDRVDGAVTAELRRAAEAVEGNTARLGELSDALLARAADLQASAVDAVSATRRLSAEFSEAIRSVRPTLEVLMAELHDELQQSWTGTATDLITSIEQRQEESAQVQHTRLTKLSMQLQEFTSEQEALAKKVEVIHARVMQPRGLEKLFGQSAEQ